MLLQLNGQSPAVYLFSLLIYRPRKDERPIVGLSICELIIYSIAVCVTTKWHVVEPYLPEVAAPVLCLIPTRLRQENHKNALEDQECKHLQNMPHSRRKWASGFHYYRRGVFQCVLFYHGYEPLAYGVCIGHTLCLASSGC